MKIRITMKDPDGFHECVRAAVTESLPQGLSAAERQVVIESRIEEIGDVLGRWFEYSEYLTVEVDTDAKTISFVENKQ